MPTDLELLIDMSNRYGSDKDYIIASGGNASFKTDRHLWITASGSFLGSLVEADLLKLSRTKLAALRTKTYEADAHQREEQVKNDLISTIDGDFTGVRPSVETSLHDLIEYPFVLHTHPTLVNGLLCGNNAESETQRIFGDTVLYIGYHDPGFTLFQKVMEGVLRYRLEQGTEPKIIFLRNHGIFVGGESPEEITRQYDMVMEALKREIKSMPDLSECPPDALAQTVLSWVEAILARYGRQFFMVRNHALIESYLESEQTFEKISKPFTPDIIVFCKSGYLYVNAGDNPDAIIASLERQIESYHAAFKFLPKVILIKHVGLISVADNETYASIILDIFEDLIKISHFSESFGGPHFMNPREISFIEEWEAEKYRFQMAQKK
jgi:rhamnose utilization protein RhaD (predicted bifunctional aldolase and dehydrogenase)